MALEQPANLPAGFSAGEAYWRIEDARFQFPRTGEPTVMLLFRAYLDKAAFEAGKPSLPGMDREVAGLTWAQVTTLVGLDPRSAFYTASKSADPFFIDAEDV